MPTDSAKFLGPWRRRFQWATSLLIVALPWLRADGESLLRIDLGTLSLYLFGQRLHIEELYLFLFFCLALVLAFLLVTLVFGRLWCGWACPQTTLSDVADWMARLVGLKVHNNGLHGPLWRKALLQTGYLALALLVGANLVWYFIEPQRFFLEVATGRLHAGAAAALIITAGTVYLDLALMRRLMCRDFCPYGRFQTVLVDSNTLTLHLPESQRGNCIDCGACVRSCPMEIDIRRGYQVECINCGRCLDACRQVMASCKQQGLIRYSFGLQDSRLQALFNPRTIILAVATVSLLAALAFSIMGRPTATLKVARSHTAQSRLLQDGQLATFFSVWVSNRGEVSASFSITARKMADGSPLPLKGQTRALELAPGSNRQLEFALVTVPPQGAEAVEFQLVSQDGALAAVARAQITPPRNR